MDKTGQQSQTTDVRTTQVSKKVWDLEGNKSQLANVNGDGSIPTNLYRTMKSNTMIPTDYINSSNERLHLTRINNRIYKQFLLESEG